VSEPPSRRTFIVFDTIKERLINAFGFAGMAD